MTISYGLGDMAEINVNWNNIQEDDRLVNRTRYWWKHSSLETAFNIHNRDRQPKQYGGVALWSIGKAVHRIHSRGRDQAGLGHSVWVHYKGKVNTISRVITVYRPAIPQGGPFTVYAQHRTTLLKNNNNRCPRTAFVEDLVQKIKQAMLEGDNIVLLLDGNESMASGELYTAIWQCSL